MTWENPVRLLPAEPGLPSVPPASINRAAYLLSRFEQRTWGRLGLPVGSSLLAVCTGAR